MTHEIFVDTIGPSWDYRRGAFLRWGRHGSEDADPCPAYGHDPAVVQANLGVVLAAWPLESSLAVHLATVEGIGRSNAWTDASGDKEWDYDAPADEETHRHPLVRWTAHIVFAAKRTPPHPAMTAALVGHEYGHVVEEWIAHARGDAHDQKVLAEYAEMRGLPGHHHGDPGRWHDAAAEVFASDFRVLVTGIEADFWPHPGVEHPAREPESKIAQAASAWWRDEISAMRSRVG